MPNPTKIVLKWTTTNGDPINRSHSEVLADGTIVRNAAPDDQARFGVVFGMGSELISIAACGMRGATMQDFGDFPITDAQVESMCQEAARLCLVYGIEVGAGTVFTHAEHALSSGYGLPSAAIKKVWDFETLLPIGPFEYDAERHNEKATLTGVLLRNKIRRYAEKMIAWGYPKKAGYAPVTTLTTLTWGEVDTFKFSDKLLINGHLRPPSNTDDTLTVTDGFSRLWTAFKTLTDTATMTEEVLKHKNGVLV